MMATATHERVFKVHIRAPREAVWDAITSVGRRQSFYFDSVLDAELAVGKPMRYRSANGKVTFIVGEVVELVAPSRFVHTFRFTDLGEEPQLVTFELKSTDGGTELVVTHDRLDRAPKHAKRVATGWPHILGNLKSVLERGSLPWKTRAQYFAMKLFLPLMRKTKE